MNHGKMIEKVYQITTVIYEYLFSKQGGKCYVCQRSTGRARRLAVEHEHNKPGCDHAPETGCPQCIRCLACGPCNRELLGRYDVDALKRAIEVLENPPAQRWLAERALVYGDTDE